MKRPFLFFLSLFLLLNVKMVVAQSDNSHGIFSPSLTSGSVLYGNDILINNQPQQDQKNLAICSAPNGWLYAAYSFDSLWTAWTVIMRSKDDGRTWIKLTQIMYDGGITTILKKLEILVTGSDETDQKLFMVSAAHLYYPTSQEDFLRLTRWKCDPFILESTMFYAVCEPHHDISLASDQNFPALNSTPNSIGMIYSTTGTKDSIVFLSSGDGGMTLNNRRVLAVTSKIFNKVDLSYGRSSSQNTGRYYAAWEELADTSSNYGHIYTAHSNPNFNSPFTSPIKLDAIDPALTNLCKGPSIACQANNVDNDSANLTEVVLFEKFNSGTGDYDVTGFYNKKAATTNVFTRLNIAATPNNELQPAITFNPYDSTFMVTYFDSTAQKLPLLNKNLNMANPDNWNVVSPGYNDSNNLRAPNPKVAVGEGLHKPCNVWVGNQSSGNGVALFDAVYIPNVGIPDNEISKGDRVLGIFPNPCSSTVTVEFEMRRTEKITIALYDMVGQPIDILTDQMFQPGVYQVVRDVSSLPSGIYFYTFLSGVYLNSGRICIIR